MDIHESEVHSIIENDNFVSVSLEVQVVHFGSSEKLASVGEKKETKEAPLQFLNLEKNEKISKEQFLREFKITLLGFSEPIIQKRYQENLSVAFQFFGSYSVDKKSGMTNLDFEKLQLKSKTFPFYHSEDLIFFGKFVQKGNTLISQSKNSKIAGKKNSQICYGFDWNSKLVYFEPAISLFQEESCEERNFSEKQSSALVKAFIDEYFSLLHNFTKRKILNNVRIGLDRKWNTEYSKNPNLRNRLKMHLSGLYAVLNQKNNNSNIINFDIFQVGSCLKQSYSCLQCLSYNNGNIWGDPQQHSINC
ncbi:MAG: hypothetical protein HS129_15470 [Leptospiraceae bacterium]|nr:hypothetical protein [Leptospiraceae bacterium]